MSNKETVKKGLQRIEEDGFVFYKKQRPQESTSTAKPAANLHYKKSAETRGDDTRGVFKKDNQKSGKRVEKNARATGQDSTDARRLDALLKEEAACAAPCSTPQKAIKKTPVKAMATPKLNFETMEMEFEMPFDHKKQIRQELARRSSFRVRKSIFSIPTTSSPTLNVMELYEHLEENDSQANKLRTLTRWVVDLMIRQTRAEQEPEMMQTLLLLGTAEINFSFNEEIENELFSEAKSLIERFNKQSDHYEREISKLNSFKETQRMRYTPSVRTNDFGIRMQQDLELNASLKKYFESTTRLGSFVRKVELSTKNVCEDFLNRTSNPLETLDTL